jgi:hypothetical protein
MAKQQPHEELTVPREPYRYMRDVGQSGVTPLLDANDHLWIAIDGMAIMDHSLTQCKSYLGLYHSTYKDVAPSIDIYRSPDHKMKGLLTKHFLIPLDILKQEHNLPISLFALELAIHRLKQK